MIEVLGPRRQRLRHAQGDECAFFVTLSHRWPPIHTGNTSPRLLKANVCDFGQNIPWDMLSKTFQDADDVARTAGFRFIWIDSLCIIQDDLADLRKEVSQMGDIYSNSTLSIFALQPGQGFTKRPYHSRNRFDEGRDNIGPTYRYEVKAASHQTVPFEVSVRYQLSEQQAWRPMPDEPFMDDQSEKSHYGTFWLPETSSELFSRGWVFQEWLLSRRALLLGERELVLSCPHGFTSEINGFRRDRKTDCPTTGTINRFAGVYNANKHADHGADSWRRISLAYGRTKVTMPEDRAIAIEGLARRFRPDFDSAYLAGCWREFIPFQLLWTRVWQCPDSHRSRRLSFRTSSNLGDALESCIRLSVAAWSSQVPSWSWLACSDQVSYLDQGLFPDQWVPFSCKVIDAAFRTVPAMGQMGSSPRDLIVKGIAIHVQLGRLTAASRGLHLVLDPVPCDRRLHTNSYVTCLLGSRHITMEQVATDSWDRQADGEYFDRITNRLVKIECNCDGTMTQNPSDRTSLDPYAKLVELNELYIVLVPSQRNPMAYERRGLLQVAHPVAVIKQGDRKKLPKDSAWREPGALSVGSERQVSSKVFREILGQLEPLYLNEPDGSRFSNLECIFDEAVEEELVLL